jgi:hypothetical protein
MCVGLHRFLYKTNRYRLVSVTGEILRYMKMNQSSFYIFVNKTFLDDLCPKQKQIQANHRWHTRSIANRLAIECVLNSGLYDFDVYT